MVADELAVSKRSVPIRGCGNRLTRIPNQVHLVAQLCAWRKDVEDID